MFLLDLLPPVIHFTVPYIIPEPESIIYFAESFPPLWPVINCGFLKDRIEIQRRART